MLARFFSLFAGKQPDAVAIELYRGIVAQSRQPGFYSDHGVPDSLDGRFDMIVLHSFLVMRRLRRIAQAGPLNQQLFDLMFSDMDSNLREIGVGDLSVGKKVKTMAQAFYGRVESYEAALQMAEDGPLRQALARNLYAGKAEAHDPGIGAVAAYMREADARLASQPDSDIMAGNLDFPHVKT
ncbi:MAG: ubiquinol-cytochrome C chaperone family protein [Ferrovibrio sp.]|uniref:ubiquinol-cytochrome C chaperone family protein n=1 Tax=Ferrovibrio sp. TaxID=1917215 RepID=UPI00391CC978